MRIRLRTLIWLVFAAIIMVAVPWMLCRTAGDELRWQGSATQWLGAWLLLNGVGLAAWCVNLLNVEGRGTPLPLDPPKRLVATGPYRFVRNPMMLGAFLILAGEAIIAASAALAVYALAYVIGAHLFVTRWEEPDLIRRFGEAYRAYHQQVPRWFPQLPQKKVSGT